MRVLLAGLSCGLLAALPPVADAAEILQPTNEPLTQSVVSLPAGSDAVLGSNTGRHYLCIMNIGANPLTLGFDAAASYGQGFILASGGAAPAQGGWMCWEASVVTGSVVHAISAAGTTAAVLEGR